jgi:threonine synthase
MLSTKRKTGAMSFLSHLECGLCGKRYDADRLWNVCTECKRPLLARYDLDSARRSVGRDVASRPPRSIWRIPELMPVRDPAHRITLGEGNTPLLSAPRLARQLHIDTLYIKDESLNPTGSFKARGMAAAVSRAVELGATALSVPSAGNAGGALAAYAARAGVEAHVYMPADVPDPFIVECRALGASVTLVDGLITDCGQESAADAEAHDRFDMATLKEPYRVEGKKTLGYELAEQMGWDLPDVVVYPTGGGTGLIGMWKAFDELEVLGWIGSKRPRMVTVQADGCAPVVRAFERGDEFAEPWKDATTVAGGLRVPALVADFLALRALRESGGAGVTVSDADMIAGANLMGSCEGVFAAPEGGATVAAAERLVSYGWIQPGETVVLFNTGSGHKYSDAWDED